MTDAALDGLIGAEEALIDALDTGTIDAVEAAMARFGAAVGRLRPFPGEAPDPALAAQAARALALTDQVRARIRFLADRNQQRIDLLAAAANRFDITPATYSRR